MLDLPDGKGKGKPEDRKAEKTPAKIVITPELRKIWFRIRNAWNLNLTAFANSISSLTQMQSEALYDIVKVSLYKGSYAEILREHPELKVLILSDEDRLLMHDIYENLSWKLGRKEPEPADVRLARRMKSRIGRQMPDFSS